VPDHDVGGGMEAAVHRDVCIDIYTRITIVIPWGACACVCTGRKAMLYPTDVRLGSMQFCPGEKGENAALRPNVRHDSMQLRLGEQGNKAAVHPHVHFDWLHFCMSVRAERCIAPWCTC
jgi:hypothetical protein